MEHSVIKKLKLERDLLFPYVKQKWKIENHNNTLILINDNFSRFKINEERLLKIINNHFYILMISECHKFNEKICNKIVNPLIVNFFISICFQSYNHDKEETYFVEFQFNYIELSNDNKKKYLLMSNVVFNKLNSEKLSKIIRIKTKISVE